MDLLLRHYPDLLLNKTIIIINYNRYFQLYKIDVMTQSNHWFILRRYREFHSLHNNVSISSYLINVYGYSTSINVTSLHALLNLNTTKFPSDL